MADGYNYNAIAEHPLIPEFDDTLKWKWNGALLDLSELPFEEYTKTVFQTSGSGGGGGGDSTGGTKIKTNAVSVDYATNGDVYELVATMQYPSDTEITVTVSVADEPEPVEIVVAPGSITGRKKLTRSSSEPKPTVSDPAVSPVKDETYTYQVVLPEVITDKFKAYYGVHPQSQLNSLTSDIIASMSVDMIDAEGMTIKFEIPPRDIENITEDQFDDYKYALILAVPKAIYDENKFSFLEHTFQSPSEFTKKEDIVMGTSSYTVLCRTSEDVEFVSRFMQTVEYIFDIKYTE